MNKWIFLGIGVAAGSAVTFVSVRGYYKKLAFKEISECREMYKKRCAAKDLADKNSEEKRRLIEKMDAENNEKNASKMSKTDATGTEIEENGSGEGNFGGKNDPKMNKTDATDAEIEELVNRYSGGYRGKFNVFSNPPDVDRIDIGVDDDDDSDDPYEFIVDHTGPSEGYSEQPYEISEDEFASEKLYFDKVMIEYYDNGIAVLEETDEVVDALEDLIGPDILNREREENTVYIRNEARSTDYGIIFTGTTLGPEEGFD